MPTEAGTPDGLDARGTEQLAQAREWLYGVEGRTVAAGLLHRFRLAGAAGFDLEADLLGEALRNLWLRIRRHGPLDDLNPGAYLTVVMKNLLRDAVRGRRAIDAVPIDDSYADATVPVTDTGDEVTLVDALRAAVETTDAPAWAKAAAVVYVNVLAFPDAVTTSYPAPRPVQGATDTEAALWLALWFAGRRDGLFPDGEHPSPSPARVAKARSRAGTRVKQVVDHAVATVELERRGG